MSHFKNIAMAATIGLLAPMALQAQEPISVGKGSYAAYTPLIKSRTAEHSGDQSQKMQYRKLYIHERQGQPIPTNDWWTNLITEQYSGHLWSYPQMIQARSHGVDVQWPSYWLDDGTEMKSRSALKVGGENFAPASAVAESWHDWDVEFTMADGSKQMLVTMAHGMPFTWFEVSGFIPQITVGSDGSFTDADGNTLTGSFTAKQMAVHIGNDIYGVYLPARTNVTINNGVATLQYGVDEQYLVVALLHHDSDLTALAQYAYSVPRSTEVKWNYVAREGKVKTVWTVSAEDLRTGQPSQNVVQGFLPHHYRNGATAQFAFDDIAYTTPHGKLKMAEGNNFEVDYDFFGMLPCYARPIDTDKGKHPFIESRMLEMLQTYANTGTFGSDTYWGGKGLTQMALNMMFAREMGQKAIFDECRSKLKTAMVDWLTYTPGEEDYFFARYDRWGALVGYNTSYDSETFNDHHFHYGYFTLAGALLALVDDDFRDNYGQMLREVAKDYANWQRTDTRYPLFRCFDPWAGHSFAGGMGDGNGNGQESSSEAMQGWGGVYLLGLALGDDEMRDAGLFGWVSEARGTAEYWFDRHGETIDATFHTGNDDAYNIDYTRFKHPYNSNLTCHGVGYWTYFGYNSLYMQGIQWMPISPALDYLSEDKAFVSWDYDKMFRDMANGGWTKNEKNENGYLGDAGGWGNVAMAYYQRYNPDSVAAIFDMLWDANEPEARTVNTNGITYFITHSHLSYGDLDWTTWASSPSARAYRRSDGTFVYMAYNPKSTEETVDFYRSGAKVYSLKAAPRKLTVSAVGSISVDDITKDEPAESDAREEIEMMNLALHKPCTASGEENAGSLKANATDGDDATRWSSLHQDGQWISVDLGEEASIYKVKIHWEAAYASQYKIQLSNDGKTWTDAATVNGDGGWDETHLGDVKGRYLRIVGVKRATQYGISMYELQVFGQLASMKPDDLLGIKITSDDAFLHQGKPSRMKIKGYTCGKEWVDVAAEWSSADGTITQQGVFTPSKYGSAVVSATVDGVRAEKSFPVEESVKISSVKVNPDEKVIISGEKTHIGISATDQFGCPVAAEGAVIKVEEDGGTFDPSDSTFTATTAGNYRIIASVGGVADTATVSVRAFADVNLALGKPATATSAENDANTASKATDGDLGTRWESQWSGLDDTARDNQMITVDLKDTYRINKVIIHWENARASRYDLQVSTDGLTWTTLKNITSTPEADETETFAPVPARFVRMKGISRNMGYGYSIFELEVYGIEKLSVNTGIDEIGRNQQWSNAVYTIDGRYLGRGVIGSLPHGIYIIGGKKVVK